MNQSHIFDVVRRGYDRQQVDEHLDTLLSQLGEVQRAHQQEARRANWIENELRNAKAALERQASQLAESAEQGGSQQGFGYRVEKLLRAAEQEAAELRSAASREATALLEQARKEAEAHRHDVEQALIARTTQLDQQAAQRKVELDERERQIAEHAASAREEAERILAEARRRSDQLLDEAKLAAERERQVAEKLIRERQESALEELNRLRGLHDEVRGQLGRLLESLANEFGEHVDPRRFARTDRPRPTPRPSPEPLRVHERTGGSHHLAGPEAPAQAASDFSRRDGVPGPRMTDPKMPAQAVSGPLTAHIDGPSGPRKPVETNGYLREPREPLDDQQARPAS